MHDTNRKRLIIFPFHSAADTEPKNFLKLFLMVSENENSSLVSKSMRNVPVSIQCRWKFFALQQFFISVCRQNYMKCFTLKILHRFSSVNMHTSIKIIFN